MICVAACMRGQGGCRWMWDSLTPPPTLPPCRWFPPPPPPPPAFCARLGQNIPIPKIVFARCGFGTTGQWRNRKNSTGNRASSRSVGSMIGFKIGGDSSADPGFERMFCLLTGVCCYRSAHAKGVRLASRSLFSQRRRVRRRAAECRGN